MSTLGQPTLEPAWKQEVNRRLAAHKNRKGACATPAANAEAVKSGNSRAAEAAARVAARYAKAPSYSEMQAAEAHLAVRAAEIATQVALEAQAAAHSALAELHAAATEAPRGPAVIESIVRPTPIERAASAERTAVVETTPVLWAEKPVAEVEVAVAVAEPVHEEVVVAVIEPAIEPEPLYTPEPEPAPAAIPVLREGESFGVRWEPDMPVRAIEMPTPAPRRHEEFELAAEDWWTPAQIEETLHAEPIAIEAQQTHANLIEFPRELVATRKMRPRIAEAAAPVENQLSIFEVDPGMISTDPAIEEQSTTTYTGPEWSGIQLDEHPEHQPIRVEAPVEDAHRPDLAPLSRRLLAAVVDGSLILASFFVFAMMVASRMSFVPSPKAAEVMTVLGLAITGFLYHMLFFRLGNGSTPGMRYANLAFCTFDDELPTQDQLRRRLVIMLLSLVPVGLGMVWALFDEDHLSWHDRISGTYVRKRF